MANNDFLPFATDFDANVVTAGAWAEDTERGHGFFSGPARSAKFNTVWRQAMFVSAAIAQFIAETTNEDVLDNGNLPELVNQFRRAIGMRRRILHSDLDLYVATTGSDDNPGTREMPFQTLQAAADYVIFHIDIGQYSVNINVAPGAYPEGVVIAGAITAAPQQLNFIGNENDPSSVIIAKTSGVGTCFEACHGAAFCVKGFEVHNTTIAQDWLGSGFVAWEYGSIFAANVNLGQCTNHQVYLWNAGAGFEGNIRIVGSAPTTFFLDAGANIGVVRARLAIGAFPIPQIHIFAHALRLSQAYFQFEGITGQLQGAIQAISQQNAVLTSSTNLPGTEPPQALEGGLYFGPSTTELTPTSDIMAMPVAHTFMEMPTMLTESRSRRRQR